MAGLIPKATEDRVLWGIGLTLLAYLAFSGIDASVKWLGEFGYPALQLAFMRYLAHFFIATSRVVSNGASLSHFASPHLGLVILRGGLVLCATVFNFVALKYLPLTLTSTILFSSPIIVCLLSGTVLGEKVGKWRWLAILFGFIGVIIAIRPFDESFHPAALLSLLGVTCFAFYLLLTRRLAGIVASDTMQFYSGAVGAIALLPVAIYQWQTPENFQHWLLMIALGIFGWIGHELLTRAYGYADASVLTPFSYSFMIYLTIWSIVLFDQYPDQWTLIGGLIIVTSGLVIWLREKVNAERQAKATAA
ncbi:MAG: drug/metabolite transporter (DMT)-like permease [Parasphingorhabdus sp.]|jgi:drug/metabolite transporter (DMT)-like permease